MKLTLGKALWLMPDRSLKVRWLTQGQYDRGEFRQPHPDARFLVAGGGIRPRAAWKAELGYQFIQAEDPGAGTTSNATAFRASDRQRRAEWREFVMANHHSVTFDASANSAGNGVASLTFAHTMSASANGYIAVLISQNQTMSSGTVTYNAASCSQRTSRVQGAVNAFLYDKVAPASGTHNVVITPDGSSRIIAGSISATGVDQTTPCTGTITNAGNGNTATLTVTTAADEVVIVGHGNQFNSATLSWAGSTEDWNAQDGGGNFRGAGAHKAISSGTSEAITYNLVGTLDWTMIGTSLKSAAAVRRWLLKGH